jgi:TRAP-type C4-dicarboxylate transport system permease large subunit
MTGALPAGVIAASGTLAQIIPPIAGADHLADQLGRSVGDMYKGAFLPGLMLTGFVCPTYGHLWRHLQAPVGARTAGRGTHLREDNGKSGLPSLLVLTASARRSDLCGQEHACTAHLVEGRSW